MNTEDPMLNEFVRHQMNTDRAPSSYYDMYFGSSSSKLIVTLVLIVIFLIILLVWLWFGDKPQVTEQQSISQLNGVNFTLNQKVDIMEREIYDLKSALMNMFNNRKTVRFETPNIHNENMQFRQNMTRNIQDITEKNNPVVETTKQVPVEVHNNMQTIEDMLNES